MKEAKIYQLNADDISILIQSAANDVLITREKAAELVDVDPDTIDRFADAGVLTRYYDSRPNTKRPIVRFLKSELMTKTFQKIRRL